MANFCIKPDIKSCIWRYNRLIIGTDKKLCNCYSPAKPCQIDSDAIDEKGRIKMEFPKYGDVKAEEDIKEFFGVTREELLKPFFACNDENELKRNIFANANNIGRREVNRLYEESDYYLVHLQYITDNFFTNFTKMKPEDHFVFKLCMDNFKDPKNTKVLDYGCGHGNFGLSLALKGYDITLADLDSPIFRFLQFLCKKYRVGVNFVTCIEEYEDLPGEYDYIICSEVLEHVDEPEQLIDVLVKRLKDNGIIYLSTFFDDCNGEDPSHLRKNTIRYQNSSFWLGQLITQHNIAPFYKDAGGSPKGFRKIK